MSVQYRIQAGDEFYATAFQRHFQQHASYRSISTIRIVGIIVLLLCAAATALQGHWKPALASLGAVSLVILSRPLDRFIRHWKIRRSPFWNEVFKMELSEQGFKSSSPKANVELTWEAFTKAIRFSDGVLLYQGPNAFYWLPNTSLLEGDTIGQAEWLICQHVAVMRTIDS